MKVNWRTLIKKNLRWIANLQNNVDAIINVAGHDPSYIKRRAAELILEPVTQDSNLILAICLLATVINGPKKHT